MRAMREQRATSNSRTLLPLPTLVSKDTEVKGGGGGGGGLYSKINVVKLGQASSLIQIDSHVTTYLLLPHSSIRQAEMEECSIGATPSLGVPTLTLEEAFGKSQSTQNPV